MFQMREDSACKVSISLCILLAILGFSLYSLIIFLPQSTLLFLVRKFSFLWGIDFSQIVSQERLDKESLSLFNRFKIILPVFSTFLLIWAFLGRRLSRKAVEENILDSENKVISYPSISILSLLGFLFLAGVLRLLNFNQSFWYDEIYSLRHFIEKGFLGIITNFRYFNNHILYSILARISLILFGQSEWSLRLPSLVFGLLGVWALLKFSGFLQNKTVIYLSAFLFVFSPLHIDQSSQARGYTALVFFSLISSYSLLRALREGRLCFWWLFMISSLLGIYSHLNMFIVFLSQVLFVLLGVFFLKDKRGNPLISFKSGKRFFIFSTLTGFIIIILYLPVLPYLLFELFRNYPPQVLDLNFLFSVIKILGCGWQGLDSGFVYFILFLLGLVSVWFKDRYIFFLTGLYFITPLVFYSFIKPPYLYPRFFIFILPFYLLLVGEGVYLISQKFFLRQKSILYLLFILLVISLNSLSIYYYAVFPRQEYRQAGEFIKRVSSSHTVVIAPGIAGEEISYYLKDIPVVKVDTLEEVVKIIKEKPHALFFLTYKGSISPQILKFIQDNYRLMASYPSLISSTYVYGESYVF